MILGFIYSSILLYLLLYIYQIPFKELIMVGLVIIFVEMWMVRIQRNINEDIIREFYSDIL